MKGFRDFLSRGNVIDLAVAVVIGTAFTAVVSAVVYYLIVAPMAKINSRFHKNVEATTRDCPECLSTIPIAATRCMYCTVQVRPVGPVGR